MNRNIATLAACLIALAASVSAHAQDYRYLSKGSYSNYQLKSQAQSLIATSSFQRYMNLMPSPQLERSPSYTQWRYQPNSTINSISITLPDWYRKLLLDRLYDYRVEWAVPVDGQIEYVLDVKYPGDSQWTRLHRFEWCGSVDHGSWCDRGEHIFTSWYAANWKGQKLLNDGEITDYEVIARPKTAQWQYLATFDTRAEAEEYADAMEHAAELLGQSRTVRIVAIPE